jgi:hypothetical protein
MSAPMAARSAGAPASTAASPPAGPGSGCESSSSITSHSPRAASAAMFRAAAPRFVAHGIRRTGAPPTSRGGATAAGADALSTTTTSAPRGATRPSAARVNASAHGRSRVSRT